MTRYTNTAAIAIAALVLSGCSRKSPTEKEQLSGFAQFIDEYFDRYFDFRPSEATSAGIHAFDAKLEDFSSRRVTNRIAELHGFAGRLNELRKAPLAPEEQIDVRFIDNRINAELLDLETIRTWRRNPLVYVRVPGNAVDLLMKRDFATPAERLRSLNARLLQVETLLNSMNDNVIEPPREFTQLASRIAASSVTFFRNTVAAWAKQAAADDVRLLAEFQMNSRKATNAMEVAARYLERDLLPLSTGNFAIGPDNFRRKLEYEEMVDLPLDQLLVIGEANLGKDYEAFVETARKIDAGRGAADVMRSISNDHPAEAGLIDFAKETAESIRKFIVDKRIITIPSEVRPNIQPTPPYARTGTFASMDTPGPFETKATEAFYYITPTEADWTPAHKEEHLRLFNRAVMDIITIHEAYPGHYTQFLYASQFPTKTRKLLYANSNAEGWAHYAEQMMIEEGFGAGDPKIRLAQLSEALLRDCRYIAGIKLHTQNMSVEQASRLFVEKGFQEPANAYEEARRGTFDPTYLYYTLGKLQIYKLRADYKRKHGASYSLESFHSDFVKQGALPIKLIREILLPGDHQPSI